MKKYWLIFAGVIVLGVGLYMFRNVNPDLVEDQEEKITQTETENLTTEESLDSQIVRALAAKNSWDEAQMELNVTTVQGDFAKGNVKFKDEMGGGMWFAAKVDDNWEIVYDGNGVITCGQLVGYPDFPRDLIPTCYDEAEGDLVTR